MQTDQTAPCYDWVKLERVIPASELPVGLAEGSTEMALKQLLSHLGPALPLPLPFHRCRFQECPLINLLYVQVLVAQSCLTLRDPICSPPGSSFMGFSKQEYRSGLPFPSPGDLPYPGIEPGSPALQADCLPSEAPGKPINLLHPHQQLRVCFPG